TWIWDQLLQPVPLSGYLLIALAVVTLGVLTGAWIGDAALLIGLGAALSIALAISLFSVTRTGDLHYTPESAAQVDTTYENGIGRLKNGRASSRGRGRASDVDEVLQHRGYGRTE